MRTVRQKRDMWIVEEDSKVLGIFYSKDEANAAAGVEEKKLAGAIVEESILAADLNDDGVIEKAELEEWLEDEQ